MQAPNRELLGASQLVKLLVRLCKCYSNNYIVRLAKRVNVTMLIYYADDLGRFLRGSCLWLCDGNVFVY